MARTLEDFVRRQMRLTHVYQPVILRELITGSGEVSLDQVAGAVAAVDPARRAYYRETLKRYPRKVLRDHGVAELRGGSWYLLVESSDPVTLLATLDKKIAEFVESKPHAFRGWAGGGNVRSGTRYRVIEAHDGKCAACGRSAADGVEVDVDHIVPDTLGGSSSVDNLQLLCAPCNRGKQASSTRDWRTEVVKRRLGWNGSEWKK